MKKNSNKRKWKSLSLKVQHLQLELEEREELIKTYEEEFLRAMNEFEIENLPSHKEEDVNAKVVIIDRSENFNQEKTFETGPPPEGPEEMKKLWRSIAIATHPDKTKGDEEKSELYKLANDAWRKSEYSSLYKIAIQLGIEPPDTESSYLILEDMTKELEKKIQEKEKSVLWEWGRASLEARQKILDLYLISRGKKRKN